MSARGPFDKLREPFAGYRALKYFASAHFLIIEASFWYESASNLPFFMFSSSESENIP